MIYIDCTSGLGNKLLRIIGGIYTAQRLGHSFKLFWPRMGDCDIDYNDLFDSNFSFITKEEYLSHKHAILKKEYFFVKRNSIFYTVDCLDMIKHDDSVVIAYRSNTLPPQITDNDIFNIMLKCKIKPFILKKAINFINKHKINTERVGLSVRLGDMYQEKTIQNAISILTTNLNKKFFVSSDDKEFIDSISNFKNVIVYKCSVYPETYSRDYFLKHFPQFDIVNKTPYVPYRSDKSVIESFVKLLILSQTTVHPSLSKRESFFRQIAERFAYSLNLRLLLLHSYKPLINLKNLGPRPTGACISEGA